MSATQQPGTASIMKSPSVFSLGLALLAGLLVTPVFAVVNIDYVSVGNAGNVADLATGYGSVSYAYQMAKNETTIGQYVEFLNAVAKTDTHGLYNTNMGTDVNIAGIARSGESGSYSYSLMGSGSRPITYVSWFDAARFCNWMQNGQGAGSTETGAYTLINGATRGAVTRNAGATIWIPSENEWYKAAYYDPNKAGVGGYWSRATQSDNALAGNTVGAANSANFKVGDSSGTGAVIDSQGESTENVLTDVGAYGSNSDSAYGTNDQAGSVWELNEAVVFGDWHGYRGGSWNCVENTGDMDVNGDGLANPDDEYYENYALGFRVASVPEPSSIILTMLAGGVVLIRRKR